MLQELSVLASASIRNHYSQLCATKNTPITTILRDLPSCTSTYEAGLQEAAALQQQSMKQSTVKARISVARELMDWLQSMHRSMVTAIPEDTLVFFTQHWLPNHAGSSTPAGRLIAAPTSLQPPPASSSNWPGCCSALLCHIHAANCYMLCCSKTATCSAVACSLSN